jgi:hypothetical protein
MAGETEDDLAMSNVKGCFAAMRFTKDRIITQPTALQPRPDHRSGRAEAPARC